MPRKQISPQQKLQVVLEALKEERHIADIASEYGVHHSAIHRWKNELLNGADKVFAPAKGAKAAAREKREQEKTIENLYAQVDRLTTQLDWLKKNLMEFCPVNERKTMVEWYNDHPYLTIKAQAQLLSINRTSLYRVNKGASELEIRIKHLIDRIHTDKPFKGSRTIKNDINDMNLGFKVNRKRIQRYMREMGIQVIYPGPNLSKRNRAQYVYPYLLRDVKPAHPNHIWGIDITYVAMQGRWMYLVPIIDWYSRAVVGHELAHTMNKEFVISAVDGAIKKHGAPIILNSDQGSQFTSSAYIDKLKENGIKISMDGKGRALDNQYETPRDLRKGIDAYIRYYNHERRHSSIGDRRPMEVYYSTSYLPQRSA